MSLNYNSSKTRPLSKMLENNGYGKPKNDGNTPI